MKLDITQLLALASDAGFAGNDLATAVAIALAESGGNPQAYNPERAAGAVQGKGSFGLWQIYITAHPELAGQNLFDPATNAAAAYLVYSQAGGSFQPWSTFKNGAYVANLDAVNQTILASQPPQDVVASDAGGDGSTTDSSGTPADGSGTPGDGGNIAGMLIFGALALWGILKITNG